MGMVKKTVITLLLVVITVTASGCWNYREIENLAAVYSFALDKGSNNKGYCITAEVGNLESAVKGSTVTPMLLSAEGATIMEAVSNLSKTSDKILYWSQAKVGIISTKVAEEGIRELVDALLRSSETRIDMYLIVSKEKTAKEILMLSKNDKSQMLGVKLAQLIENQHYVSKSPMVHVYEIADMLANMDRSGIMGVVGISSGSGKDTMEVSGTAIFKGQNMKGLLEGDETKYLLFATNDMKESYVSIDGIQADPQVKASVHIEKSKTSITPVYDGNEISMDINIKVEGGIEEILNPNNIDNKVLRAAVIRECEKKISDGTQEIIHKVQEDYEVDAFGFFNTFIRKKTSLWRKVEGDWDKVFSNMDVRVNSKIHITNTGEIEILPSEEL